MVVSAGGAVKGERVVTDSKHQQLLSETGASRLQAFGGVVPPRRRENEP